MNIVVLSGGLSTERDVSISSGIMVSNALREKGHNVVLLDVFMGYEESPEVDITSLFEKGYDFTKNREISTSIPDIEKIKSLRKYNSTSFLGMHVENICKYADICFLALHGDAGENGQLQATFDLLGIKYTGSNYMGSCIAMNKAISKSILLYNNVNMAKGISVKKGETYNFNTFPCVVKPCSGGSSVGVSIANNQEELKTALATSFEFENEVIVEQFIKGREFSIGILGDKALPIIEIIPKQGFYDYANKYQAGSAIEICPAKLCNDLTNRMQQEALKVHNCLNLNAYSRVDFLLDENNEFYCLEANTLPGMTPTSLLPQEAQAIGIDFSSLCDEIINLSFKKYN